MSAEPSLETRIAELRQAPPLEPEYRRAPRLAELEQALRQRYAEPAAASPKRPIAEVLAMSAFRRRWGR